MYDTHPLNNINGVKVSTMVGGCHLYHNLEGPLVVIKLLLGILRSKREQSPTGELVLIYETKPNQTKIY